jgi:hypothetical protein
MRPAAPQRQQRLDELLPGSHHPIRMPTFGSSRLSPVRVGVNTRRSNGGAHASALESSVDVTAVKRRHDAGAALSEAERRMAAKTKGKKGPPVKEPPKKRAPVKEPGPKRPAERAK